MHASLRSWVHGMELAATNLALAGATVRPLHALLPSGLFTLHPGHHKCAEPASVGSALISIQCRLYLAKPCSAALQGSCPVATWQHGTHVNALHHVALTPLPTQSTGQHPQVNGPAHPAPIITCAPSDRLRHRRHRRWLCRGCKRRLTTSYDASCCHKPTTSMPEWQP